MTMANTHELHVPKNSDFEASDDHAAKRANTSQSPRSAKEQGPPGYWPKALSTPWLLLFLCSVLLLITALEFAARALPQNSRQKILDLRNAGHRVLERRSLATIVPDGMTDGHVTSGIATQTLAKQELLPTLNQSRPVLQPYSQEFVYLLPTSMFMPLELTITMSILAFCPICPSGANGQYR
jgi:hypothetical protein